MAGWTAAAAQAVETTNACTGTSRCRRVEKQMTRRSIGAVDRERQLLAQRRQHLIALDVATDEARMNLHRAMDHFATVVQARNDVAHALAALVAQLAEPDDADLVPTMTDDPHTDGERPKTCTCP